MKFYRCEHCGNIMTKLHDSGILVVCCGDEMTLLEANTTDVGSEKHVPIINVEGNMINVKVGSIPHPMELTHYIEWIFLQTKKGGMYYYLNPNDQPELNVVSDEEIIAVYSYCNVHGLWKNTI